jgi:glycosyltransferase involved in cell wall biosynthesis
VNAAADAAPPGRPLRILFLAPQPFFEVRGTPLAVRAMVRALVGEGHAVDLLTYPQGGPADIPGLVHRRSLALPVGHVRPGPSLAKLALDVPFLAEAAWRLATGRYDVVHAVEEAAHLIAPVARLLNVPLVADVDSSIPDQLEESGFARGGPIQWAARALDRHALRHAAAVITVCRSLTDGVRERAPGARVFQVEDPPLAASGPPASETDVAALRARLGLDARPVVVYSGNFEDYQGVDRLVDAAALVPEAQFAFMGGEDAEVARQKERARAAGAAERCHFAGKRPPEELPAWLGLATVLASPRVKGVNTPFKIYTYLASGRPIVATRLPTHTQLLDDSVAWLTEPTPEGLARGIRAALADPGEARRRAGRGRALVDAEYSEERYVQKVRGAYEAIRRYTRGMAGRRILLVEDSLDSAETLAELLKIWGHDVRLAHTGEEALDVAREYRPEVILLDIGLPDLDGYAVARRLRDERLGGEMLVALTGYSPDVANERGGAVFDRHLTKPVGPDALAGLLGRK